MTFCKLLILLMFTYGHDYTSGVRAADVVLQKLRAGKVRPADLAKALDVDRSTASLMLSGKRGIPTWHLDAIAQLLSVPVPELFEPPGMSRRRQSDKNKYGTAQSPVAQWPFSGSARQTGGHDDDDEVQAALDQSDADRLSFKSELPNLEAAKRADAIIKHATLIIMLAGGTVDRPDLEAPPTLHDTPDAPSGDPPIRERHAGAPLKRPSGGRS